MKKLLLIVLVLSLLVSCQKTPKSDVSNIDTINVTKDSVTVDKDTTKVDSIKQKL